MTKCGLIASLVLSCGLLGCATKQETPAPQREVALSQRNDLALVRLRAQDLRRGMTKADVYNLLGSPAEYRDGAWVYRGEGDALVVRFDGDRYASHGGDGANPRSSGG